MYATETPFFPFQHQLDESFHSEGFQDTKIILYSRRDANGTLSKPRALYANSVVLRKHFPGFAAQLLDKEEKERAEGHEYPDSDFEDDEGGTSTGQKIEIDSTKGRLEVVHPTVHSPNDHAKRVIKIRDTAFVTFQAALLYMYTGHIEFAENRRSKRADMVSSSEDSIPRPSPRSIYRFAKKYSYSLNHLEELALGNVRSRLNRQNIVEELFSEFSLKNHEVQTMVMHRLAFMMSGKDESSTMDLWEKIDKGVDSLAKDSRDLVDVMWTISMRGAWPVLYPLDNTVKPAKDVEIALIKSIHNNVVRS